MTEPEPEAERGLWWLSFVDTEKSVPPEEQVSGGSRFLGVCIVEAEDPIEAVKEAWRQECNPGGQVQIVGPGPIDAYPPEALNRLLTAEEAKQL
jgi:hypothetical protein